MARCCSRIPLGCASTCADLRGPSLAIGRLLSSTEYPMTLKSSMVKGDMNSNSAGCATLDAHATGEHDVRVSIDSLRLAQPRTDPARLRWHRTWRPKAAQVASELSMWSPREDPRFSRDTLASYVGGGPHGLRGRGVASDEDDLLLVEGSSTITSLSGSGSGQTLPPPEPSSGKPIP